MSRDKNPQTYLSTYLIEKDLHNSAGQDPAPRHLDGDARSRLLDDYMVGKDENGRREAPGRIEAWVRRI